MVVNFTKMQGLGNDFMVIDNTMGDISFTSEQVVFLADRKYGVGFDQLVMVESSTSSESDFRYTIFNSDGSEVSQCGNGARCFARFVEQKKLTNKKTITVETSSGLMELQIIGDEAVRVDMGTPKFDPADIPLLFEKKSDLYSIEGHNVGALSIGNPHCIIILDEIDSLNIEPIAVKIQQSEVLPEQANIGFMKIISPTEISLRVYERGAGETLACGSGACAAVIFGVILGSLEGNVTVNLIGGRALVEYTKNEHVFLSGPGEFVFDGQISV
ncbi:MAG: diaminopimelate epimerase [PS1 clade bacterium]